MDVFIIIVEYVGIVAFAISGAMVAIDKEADLFGVVMMAVITSFAGGIFRDLLLGITPPRFFTHYGLMVIVAVASSIVTFIFAAAMKDYYVNNHSRVMAILNIFDAAGLGIFAVAGVAISIETVGNNPYIALTMGLITGVLGGSVRDVCLGTIPFIIRKRIYALAVLAGSAVYYVLYVLTPFGVVWSTLVASAVTFSLRILATVFKWNMPKAIIFSKPDAQSNVSDNKNT